MITDMVYRALRGYPFLKRQFKRVVLRLPHRYRKTTHLGQPIWIDPAELAGFYLYYEREYDDYIFRFLNSRMPNYEMAIDVGAHFGIYTIYFGQHVKEVLAFEPDPQVAAMLRKNIELNRMTNVTVHQSCVGSTSGPVSFLPASRANQGLGRIVLSDRSTVTRPCVTLDGMLEPCLQKSCVVKMDIEGGEWLALQGAKNVFGGSRLPLALLLETHPEDIQKVGGSIEGLKQLLLDMGFDVSGLTPRGLETLGSGEAFRFWWAEKSR